MWNKELYVREQQDAYEFFTSLIDQMDEYLKVEKTCIFPSHSQSLAWEQYFRIWDYKSESDSLTSQL